MDDNKAEARFDLGSYVIGLVTGLLLGVCVLAWAVILHG